MTDKEIISRTYENVEYLAKIHQVPIGILETAIGVSIGYFARSRKRNTIMPITTIVRIAEYFNIPTDYLVYQTYKANYLRQQIEALNKELEKVEKGENSNG